MSDARLFVMAHDIARTRAVQAVKEAPAGYVVRIEPPKRNGDQNAKFHAICSDIARAGIQWAGKPRNPAEWKVLLVSGHSAATKQGSEMVPGIEGEFVNVREATSRMSKARAASLIEYAIAFAAMHGVDLVGTETMA